MLIFVLHTLNKIYLPLKPHTPHMTKLYKQEGIPFTQVNNDIFYDKNLSFKAIGIYAYMYSKPDGRDFAAERMGNDAVDEDGEKAERKDRKTAIQSGINELIAAGRMQRKKRGDGRIDYIIYWQKGEIDPEPQNQVLGSINNKETRNNNYSNIKKDKAEPKKTPKPSDEFKKANSTYKPKKVKELPSQYRQNVVDLRKFRNTLAITDEKTLTKNMQRVSHAVLLDMPFDEIKKAMQNFADILHSPETYRNHKRSFQEFMQRKNGVWVFVHKTIKDYPKENFDKANARPSNGVFDEQQYESPVDDIARQIDI